MAINQPRSPRTLFEITVQGRWRAHDQVSRVPIGAAPAPHRPGPGELCPIPRALLCGHTSTRPCNHFLVSNRGTVAPGDDNIPIGVRRLRGRGKVHHRFNRRKPARVRHLSYIRQNRNRDKTRIDEVSSTMRLRVFKEESKHEQESACRCLPPPANS